MNSRNIGNIVKDELKHFAYPENNVSSNIGHLSHNMLTVYKKMHSALHMNPFKHKHTHTHAQYNSSELNICIF